MTDLRRPSFRSLPPQGPPKPTARQRVLAAWRGADLPATAATDAHPAQSLARVMPQVLNALRMDRRRAEAEIVRVWNHLLDPALTAHAQPAGLARGTLFVQVDSNAWLDEIVRYRRREILDRLRHSFGPTLIQRLSFRVG